MLNIKYNEAETLHDRYIEFKAPFTNGVKTVGRVQLFAMNSHTHIYAIYIPCASSHWKPIEGSTQP